MTCSARGLHGASVKGQLSRVGEHGVGKGGQDIAAGTRGQEGSWSG